MDSRLRGNDPVKFAPLIMRQAMRGGQIPRQARNDNAAFCRGRAFFVVLFINEQSYFS